MEIVDTEDLEESEQDGFVSRVVDSWEVKYSGRKRKLQDYLRDGIKINGTLTFEDNIPLLQIGHPYDAIIGYHELWLTPEIERFILFYLCTGKATGAPILNLRREDITFRADENYIYRHLKREIERNTKIEVTESEQGTSITAYYPNGTIDYGVLPHTIEELDSILNGIESDNATIPEYDIHKLHSDNLPRDKCDIEENKKLDSVYPNGIPTNIILDKTICGIGATYLEIEKAQRHSIIIEPNVPVIIGKEKDHPQIIGVYGEMNVKQIRARIEEKTANEYIKILTTPESFKKVIIALNSLEIAYREDFFLLFDECDRIISDIDFREKIALPMDEFFQFANKAMVSATPIIIDDPRFQEHNFSVIKIKPDYYYARPLELKTTNNVKLALKRTLAKLETETQFCIFLNHVKGITEIIEYLELSPEEVSIYCSESARKNFDIEELISNVFDNLKYGEANNVILNTKYNFFTSRYYSAVDIKLNYKPTVIMLSMVYKVFPKESLINKRKKKKRQPIDNLFIPTETPFTLIEPETEAIQIAGRFRNGISRLIHITDTNSEIKWKNKADIEKFLKEEHSGYLKLQKLRKSFTEYGERYIANQAITRTDYYNDGYVTDKDEINHFRFINAYLDEILKMLYYYPAMLYNAYSNSGAFEVFSEYERYAYSEQEKNAIKSKSTLKAKRIQLLHKIFPKLMQSLHSDDQQFLEELKNEFALYFEAFNTIGYRRIKQLKFTDSEIAKEVTAYKIRKELTAKEVVKDVYNTFNEGEKYTTAFINTELERIFLKHNICLGRRIKAKDMEYYFDIEESRTGAERGWKMARKLIN